MQKIGVLPTFHYDVAYLKAYKDYLPGCYKIIDEALDILEQNPDYCFMIEQVLLMEEYWDKFEHKRELIKRFTKEGRLSFAPGMYVMPDMNHISGESLFKQIEYGMSWLKENLNYEPEVCWIADCWGHHSQLPQILRQAGYKYYVFWRCMRRDVMKNQFIWKGLDGTQIKVHWLCRGYAGIRFPVSGEAVNSLELKFTGASQKFIKEWAAEVEKYGEGEPILMCNGGDFAFPQSSGPQILKNLASQNETFDMGFVTPEKYFSTLNWGEKEIVDGEFNSALQGSFTSNIRIKQLNRVLTNKLLAIEAAYVLLNRKNPDLMPAWKLLLKQQFHDIICGTITDKAIEDCYREYKEADALLSNGMKSLCAVSGSSCVINTLSFPRTEIISYKDKRFKVQMPALGICNLEHQSEIRNCGEGKLPLKFSNAYYAVKIDESGYITSLKNNCCDEEIVLNEPAPFGSLALQMDNGDLWLNFHSPLDGGSKEAALTQNIDDPYDRHIEDSIENTRTFQSKITDASAIACNDEEIIIEQKGVLSFWRITIEFTTTLNLCKSSSMIKYETKFTPVGKHYRIRAVFPTGIKNGEILHEIPFGFEKREEHEHVAQNWMDLSDRIKGLAILNKGIPGNNVNNGIMMLTLFRSAAMEYKTESNLSFNEGVPHSFEYAVMPHRPDDRMDIIKNGLSLNNPPVICDLDRQDLNQGFWQLDKENVIVSALRWRGGDVFIRVYECLGKGVNVTLRVPEYIEAYVPVDGMERPQGGFAQCDRKLQLNLGAFQIQGVLLKTK